MKLMPASRALATIRAAVGSSVGPPNIIVPRQIGETLTPLRPRLRYSMVAPAFPKPPASRLWVCVSRNPERCNRTSSPLTTPPVLACSPPDMIGRPEGDLERAAFTSDDRDPPSADPDQGAVRGVPGADAEEPRRGPASPAHDHVERAARRHFRRRRRDPLRLPRLRQHRHPLDRPARARMALRRRPLPPARGTLNSS